MSLENWRNKIDEIDAELLSLLNRRAKYALKIGEVKRLQQLPVFDPAREEAILNRLSELNEGPLSHQSVIRLFERIIDESRHLERETLSKKTNKQPVVAKKNLPNEKLAFDK